MIYFLISISVLINLFVIYKVYKVLLAKIRYPELKERSEINSLMIEFNKTAKSNIDLIEDKIHELKSLMNLVDKKIKEVDMTPHKSDEEKNIKIQESETNVIDLNNTGKVSIIDKLIEEGKSTEEISRIMGISEGEVDLYLNLNKK